MSQVLQESLEQTICNICDCRFDDFLNRQMLLTGCDHSYCNLCICKAFSARQELHSRMVQQLGEALADENVDFERISCFYCRNDTHKDDIKPVDSWLSFLDASDSEDEDEEDAPQDGIENPRRQPFHRLDANMNPIPNDQWPPFLYNNDVVPPPPPPQPLNPLPFGQRGFPVPAYVGGFNQQQQLQAMLPPPPPPQQRFNWEIPANYLGQRQNFPLQNNGVNGQFQTFQALLPPPPLPQVDPLPFGQRGFLAPAYVGGFNPQQQLQALLPPPPPPPQQHFNWEIPANYFGQRQNVFVPHHNYAAPQPFNYAPPPQFQEEQIFQQQPPPFLPNQFFYNNFNL